MRDWIALRLIKLARYFTRQGFVDDHLAEAQEYQERFNNSYNYY